MNECSEASHSFPASDLEVWGVLLLFFCPASLPASRRTESWSIWRNEEERTVIQAEQGAEDGGPRVERPKKIMLTT